MPPQPNYRLQIHSDDMTPEERLDALAEVLAEGFLHLVENGLLKEVLKDPPPSEGRTEGIGMDRAKADASSGLSDAEKEGRV